MKKPFILVAAITIACSSSSPTSPNSDDAGVATDTGSSVTPDPTQTPDAGQPPQVDSDPTNPKDDAGHDLSWAAAPLMQGVAVVPNRDSAIVIVPAVAGAADYRVATLPDGVNVTA